MSRGDWAGTRILLQGVLRRDRGRILWWTIGLAAYTLYCITAIPAALPEEELASAVLLITGPLGALLTGPGYGVDDPTYATFFAAGYALYLVILAALMSQLLVVRNTRVEEQTGRAELIRANVVGRHAPLTAAVVAVALVNAVVAVVTAVLLVGVGGFPVAGSLLLAAGVAATGLAFAGLAALTAQVTADSRIAAGLAGAGLAAAFAIRAGGDMVAQGGSTLSWFSPLAWAQQTGPYALDRWWPLLLTLGFAAATVVAAFALSSRRDVAAGLMSVRPGPPAAAAWIGSPVTVALRLHRSTLLWWAASLAVAGVAFGAYADALLAGIIDLPETFIELMGPPETIVEGYLGIMALFYAVIIAAQAILAVSSMRSEETGVRADPVLATAVSRSGWLGANLAVIGLGAIALLVVAGVATGLGAAAVTGDVGYLGSATAAQVVYAPAVLLVLAVATLLHGVAPSWVALTWALVGYGLLAGVFGTLLGLPEWAVNLSPFEQTSRLPLEDLVVAPLVVMSGLAAVAATGGLATFRRRDINAV